MCQSTRGVQIPEHVAKVAEKELGSPCEYFYNTSKSHLISYSSFSKQVAGRTKFLVINATNAEVIESGSFRPGYIKWIDATTVEYLDAPEVIGLDDSLDNYKKTIVVKVP